MQRYLTFVSIIMAVAIGAVFQTGCEVSKVEGPSYDRALQSGQDNIELVQQFSAMFPTASHHITHFTGDYGPRIWQSRTNLYGRYAFVLQLPIEIENGSVVKSGEATFRLTETAEIVNDNGNILHSHGIDIPLNEQQWQTVVDAKGDFEAIGINLKKNEPVPGFGGN